MTDLFNFEQWGQENSELLEWLKAHWEPDDNDLVGYVKNNGKLPQEEIKDRVLYESIEKARFLFACMVITERHTTDDTLEFQKKLAEAQATFLNALDEWFNYRESDEHKAFLKSYYEADEDDSDIDLYGFEYQEQKACIDAD